VQIQGDCQTLFASHSSISLDLFLQRGFRRHISTIVDRPPRGQSQSVKLFSRLPYILRCS
jgi:hypothetical protein